MINVRINRNLSEQKANLSEPITYLSEQIGYIYLIIWPFNVAVRYIDLRVTCRENLLLLIVQDNLANDEGDFLVSVFN